MFLKQWVLRAVGGMPTGSLTAWFVRLHVMQPFPNSVGLLPAPSLCSCSPVLLWVPAEPGYFLPLCCCSLICLLLWMPFFHFPIWLTTTYFCRFIIISSRKPFLSNSSLTLIWMPFLQHLSQIYFPHQTMGSVAQTPHLIPL